MSTLASSQLPSSKSMSITSKPTIPRNRLPSITGTSPGNGNSFPPRHIGPGGITLPLNNSVSQLATLSHSAHTLSPYARGHEHIAVRSFPHLGKAGINPGLGGLGGTGFGGLNNSRPGSAIGDAGVLKAKRKRIYKLGSKKGGTDDNADSGPSSGVSTPGVVGGGLRSSSTRGGIDDSPNSGDRSQVEAWRPTSFMSSSRAAGQTPGMKAGMGIVPLKGAGGGVSSPRPNLRRNPDSRTSYGFPPPMST
ncbi:hypothetical protein I317_04201 [Kwoniella heveanensis CBS 569]|nr:hypothetical protein I317_04201 [Kwoniella heveanensis CBS 569]